MATGKTVTYLDISIVKSVTGEPDSYITSTSKLLAIRVSFDTENRDQIVVLRSHNGEAVAMTENPADGEEGFVVGSGYIIIYTQNFSDYAIAYHEVGTTPVYRDPEFYNLIFMTNGGEDMFPLRKNFRDVVDLTLYIPVREGYVFEGWYADAALTNPVTEVTMYVAKRVWAKWSKAVEKPECEGGEDCPASVFEDLDLSQWYHDGVHYCVEHGLMDGVSDTRFDPDGTATRAMIVTLLWRLEGEPDAAAPTFTDVTVRDWYYDAIAWAQEVGIVDGMTETEFMPDLNITHQQMVTMLYRYAAFKGCSVEAVADLSAYEDISDWAEDAMAWAFAEKLLSDKTGFLRAPDKDAIRCEMADIIYRFDELVR